MMKNLIIQIFRLLSRYIDEVNYKSALALHNEQYAYGPYSILCGHDQITHRNIQS